MEVAVDCSWVGDGVGSVAAPVGVALGVAGVTAGMGTVFVGVNAGVGPGGRGLRGKCRDGSD